MSLPYLTPLSPDQRTAAGVTPDFPFAIADRVRFHELDVLDHVNNAVYLSWFETFRIHYLRSYGISDYTSAEDRPVLVLRNVDIEFKAPLYLDETYVVAGRSLSYRNTSWKMQYAVFARGQLCALGHAVIVLMEQDTKTRRRLPEGLIEVITSRDGAIFEG